MATFNSFFGRITLIEDFLTGEEASNGCYKLMSVQNREGNVVNFVVSPGTYFVDQTTMKTGDPVTGFYDAEAPVPMIFPPRYEAIVMARSTRNQNVTVDYFNNELINSNNTLKLNIAPNTQILLENAQTFTGNPQNKYLIVVYGATTRSIPAQTTPFIIIVMCSQI